jgi:hypothetical protein
MMIQWHQTDNADAHPYWTSLTRSRDAGTRASDQYQWTEGADPAIPINLQEN